MAHKRQKPSPLVEGMSRQTRTLALLLLVGLAGCFDSTPTSQEDSRSPPQDAPPPIPDQTVSSPEEQPREPDQNATEQQAPALPPRECVAPQTPIVAANTTVDAHGATKMVVPLDVVMVGFPRNVSDGLQQRLGQATVPQIHAMHADFGQSPVPQPLEATVAFNVRHLPDDIAQDFRASVMTAPEDPGLLDGNAAEATLAALLRCSGVALQPNLPTMVIIHLGDDRVDNHLWLYRAEPKPEPDGKVGWLANIRSFGGTEPMIILDVSASKNPSPDRGYSGRGFEAPQATTDESLADDLHEAVVAAASLRFFPRMVQPSSIAPCSSITIVYGIRTTSLGEEAPLMLRPDQQIHAERIRTEFEALTGRPATVDLRTVLLPTDDLEFDALARLLGAAFVAYLPDTYTSLVGIYEPLPPETQPARSQALEAAVHAFGQWVDLVWDDYVQPGPGCEGYLGFMVWADAAEFPHNYGVGPTSPQGHRYVVGSMGVYERYISDPGPAPALYGQRAAWQGSYDIADPMLVHEFGHNMGLPHPHIGPGGPADWSFSSDRTTMSYRWQGISAELGAIDHATIVRARAGFAIQDAAERGVLDTPAGQEAIDAMNAWDWQRAADALLDDAAPGAP